MHARTLLIVSGVLLTLGFAPAPLPRRPAGPVERALAAYCARTGVPRQQVVRCETRLFPGSAVYRHPLPAVEKERLGDRHAVLVVHEANGGVLDLRLTPNHPTADCVEDLLAGMRRAGKTVKNTTEGAEVFEDLCSLGYWLTSADPTPREREFRDQVGSYRGRENTYGGLGYCPLAGGDDFGFEVDRDGFVVRLLSGHIK